MADGGPLFFKPTRIKSVISLSLYGFLPMSIVVPLAFADAVIDARSQWHHSSWNHSDPQTAQIINQVHNVLAELLTT